MASALAHLSRNEVTSPFRWPLIVLGIMALVSIFAW
jgi:hypothetical protein